MTNHLDVIYMQSAVDAALEGVKNSHGGPFGCAIVRQGKVIAATHNTVLTSNDSTNHAEMNCLRAACKVLKTHDLSDCDVYTSCEPCPMCWGACIWARIRKLFIGVDRKTAAGFGFDDENFYQELDNPKHLRSVPFKQGLLREDIYHFFKSTPTYRRRLLMGGGMLAQVSASVFTVEEHYNNDKYIDASGQDDDGVAANHRFMSCAIEAAKEGMQAGENKERESFAAVIVKNGEVIARAYNTVLKDRDPTATAEINAVRMASKLLGMHNLEGCHLYCTVEPDLMSMGAIYWSRISAVHIGVAQGDAAKFGFEEGLMQYKELRLKPGDRSIPSVYNVGFDRCRGVFELWRELNGSLY